MLNFEIKDKFFVKSFTNFSQLFGRGECVYLSGALKKLVPEISH